MGPLLALLCVLPSDSFVRIERAFPRLRFERPILLTHAGDGSGRIFVAEQGGRIRVFSGKDEDVAESRLFLDITGRVSRSGNEEGLLGLAFPPDYAESGQFYVHYSSAVRDQVSIVARFHVDPEDPNRALPDSEELVLAQPQPYRNHNGGCLAFGPRGMLYISFGDGGAANDPHGNGQNPSTFLGSILRIDVSEDPYVVPEDNPFVGREGYAGEVWAYGFRNPWRFSFDRKSGDLWVGDVGQNRFEEIDLVVRGGNYGWNAFEASHDFPGKSKALDPAEHIPPVAEYGRDQGISVTGGYVYRGARHPELAGRYFYGDYYSGNIWSLRPGEAPRLCLRSGRSISSFGEDEAGELYLCSFDGGIYRLLPSDEEPGGFSRWPRKLSQTGLFASMKDHTPAEGVLAYDVVAKFWSDGAGKERWISLPAGKALTYRPEGTFEVPVGTRIVKHFRTPERRRPRLLETRIIERTEEGWLAATYLWDRGQRDATLTPQGRQFEVYGHGIQTWQAPSASECATCHVEGAGFLLGLRAAQLDRDGQLERWAREGRLKLPEGPLPPHVALVDPYDEEAPLEQRARTWLDVNCAMCHYPGGPGNASFDARASTPLERTGLLDGEVTQGGGGIEDARLIAPGEPERSMILQRMRTLGDGRMPPLGSNRVDERGAELLAQWITSLER